MAKTEASAEAGKDNEEVLATTYSSSYLLDDMMMLGARKQGHTAQALKVGSKISVNYLFEKDGVFSDIAGMASYRVKLKQLKDAGAVIEEVGETPTLANAALTLIGTIEQIIQTDDAPEHFLIRIEERLVDETLLLESGKIDWSKFDSLIYYGAQKDRIYKGVTAENRMKASFLREHNMNKRMKKEK